MKITTLESFRKSVQTYVNVYTLNMYITADESSDSGIVYIRGIPKEAFEGVKLNRLKATCKRFKDIVLEDNEIYFYGSVS